MEPSKFPDAARTGDAAIIAPNTQPSVVQQGWVRKEGHFFKTWKRRWLVIFDDMRMMYFTDESMSTVKGEYVIKVDSSVTSLEDQPGRPNLFAVRAEGVQGADLLIVSVDSREEKARWMNSISEIVKALRSQLFK